jgi:hypothetical protein
MHVAQKIRKLSEHRMLVARAPFDGPRQKTYGDE